MINIDPTGWIPDSIKDLVSDGVIDALSQLAHKVAGEELSERIKHFKTDGKFQQALDEGIGRAAARFIEEYTMQDEDLVTALRADSAFWQARSVRQALLTILQHPGQGQREEWDIVAQHFDDVLPQRINRGRVDRAITYFMHCLTQEVWQLEELRPIYELEMQRITAERATEMVQELRGMRSDLRRTMLALVQSMEQQQRLLNAGKMLTLPEPPRVRHNLPHPDYVRFVGRDVEIARLRELLSPDSRAWVIAIDGIGGIGKSALALESADYYLREFETLPPAQRFDAIIWTSAKAMTLTADGIAPRKQITRTLGDIYTTIAITLEREDITRAASEGQDNLVRRALTQQRVMLVLDNLETIDDEQVNAFLRELPEPTKCIVTTRHRIDVSYPIRLTGMPEADALALIAQEREKKDVMLSQDDAALLYKRTGGVPLAIVWSVAQMGYGKSIEATLRRLGDAQGEIAKYCFEGALELIRGKHAHRLLMALAIFTHDANREALGYIANLSTSDRDEGLALLESLSLVNKTGNRFSFLPLTHTFALAELTTDESTEKAMRRRWIDYLKTITQGADSEYYWRYASYQFYEEGENIIDAVRWAYANNLPIADIFAPISAAYDFLEVNGRWNEILELCRPALRLAMSVQHPISIARFSNIMGWIYLQRGEYAEANDLFLQALWNYRLAKSQEGECVSLQHLSSIYRKQGDFRRARELNDQAMEIANVLGIGDLRALVLTNHGKLARDQGDWQAAWNYFSEVKDWFEQRTTETPRDEPLARSTWGHLAIVAYHLGRPQEAKELCLKSLEFFEHYGTKGYLATLLYRLALAEGALGERENALVHVRQAAYWFEHLGMKPDLVEALNLLEHLQPSTTNQLV